MPKVTEKHLEARRQQILDAAAACFARQGFHQTTMSDICREADLSPGAIYRYFQSKEEIIEASCAGCEQIGAAAFEAVGQGISTMQFLDTLSEKAFSDLEDPQAASGLRLQVQWWSEAMRSPQLGELLRQRSVGTWKGGLAQIVARAQEMGEIDQRLDPEAAGRVLLSMWLGLVLQKALDPAVQVQPYLEVVKAMYHGSFWRRVGGDAGSE